MATDGAAPAFAGGVTDGDVGSGSWFDTECVTLPCLPPGLEDVTKYEYVNLRWIP
jgi:uncharacterized membrane protein YhdT